VFGSSRDEFVRILIDRDSLRGVIRIASTAEEASSADTTETNLVIRRGLRAVNNEEEEFRLEAREADSHDGETD
jgi:hypothetical protein